MDTNGTGVARPPAKPAATGTGVTSTGQPHGDMGSGFGQSGLTSQPQVINQKPVQIAQTILTQNITQNVVQQTVNNITYNTENNQYTTNITQIEKSFCFLWGGRQWGGDFPGWLSFVNYLVATGVDPMEWALDHPDAAQCIGAALTDDARRVQSAQPSAGARFVAFVRDACGGGRDLDPLAVLANALNEGASGAIGDSGEAYGPWQMHQARNDGPIPASFDHYPNGSQWMNRWAWSEDGITFALDRIANVAHGLRGYDAVDAIVTGFERPADIPGAITRRRDTYDNLRSEGDRVWAELASSFPGASLANVATIPAPEVPAVAPTAPQKPASLLAAWQELLGVLAHQLPDAGAAASRVAGRLTSAVK